MSRRCDLTGKGPQVILSRTHRDLLRRLFELEVPEIYNGTVEIKGNDIRFEAENQIEINQSVVQHPGVASIATIRVRRDTRGGTWRGTAEVPPNKTTAVTVKADAQGVAVEAKPGT